MLSNIFYGKWRTKLLITYFYLKQLLLQRRDDINIASCVLAQSVSFNVPISYHAFVNYSDISHFTLYHHAHK